MANLLNSESRRMYSWWWDSHNTPKNSKWIKENLTDMDGKVKSMIKLIEEDADSFARRAEMYYKKRPELMKLVEEFYRAYRALAERYNHATGELRHAQQTIAKVFPNQLPFEVEDQEIESTARVLFDVDDMLENAEGVSSTNASFGEDSNGIMRKRGLKQLAEIFGSTPQNDKSADGRKAESELQGLKKALAEMQAEKAEVLRQYEECLQKLSKVEGELDSTQKDSTRLNEKATMAETEVRALKEALSRLEAEKNLGTVEHEDCLAKISHLEALASKFQEDMKRLDNKAIDEGSRTQNLKDDLSRLELEKEAVSHQCKQCVSKILDLENLISVKEDETRTLQAQAESAEAEVSKLKLALADLNREKEASALQYECCLKTISKLEKEISSAKNDVKRLNNDIWVGAAKLNAAEGKCLQLEVSNQTLRIEADNLAKKISTKDRQLLKKQEELEKLQTCLEDGRLRCEHVEATLQALQDLHCRSQDDQTALAMELENVVQKLRDMEVRKSDLEKEIHLVSDENNSLRQVNLSSAVSIENMQNEIDSLREMKERLENEVSHRISICISLQQEISCLKSEIEGLNTSYQALVEQVEAAGLDPKCVGDSMKTLQDETSRLREMYEEGTNDKAILLKKLENMEEVLKNNTVLQSSLSVLNGEVKSAREKANELQESCHFLQGEKSSLVAERASLLTQLQTITENMHNLLRKNAVLENSLSTAKVELEGFREKSKGLEEICGLLKNQSSHLLAEKNALVLLLEKVEAKLEFVEKRYMGLEEKYANLQKEKESMHCQVEKLEASLGIEKLERSKSRLLSETRLVGLENQIHSLQEESRWKKKESEEERDRALKAQFEISIFQKFVKDMEEKNYTLLIECQKHVEASKLTDKLISKLESENLEQQVEAELLLDEIERLRLGIYQIFMVLETCPDYNGPDEKVENEQAFVHQIVQSIEDMKCSISEHEDEKQQLLVEKSVLLALLQQMESKGVEIMSQKMHLQQEFNVLVEKLSVVENENETLQDLNSQLKCYVNDGHRDAALLKDELAGLCAKHSDLEKAYNALQDAYSLVNHEKLYLLKKLSDLSEEKYQIDQYNDAVLHELFATAFQSTVLRNFGFEKVMELKLVSEDANRQSKVNGYLEKEMKVLREELEVQKTENRVSQSTMNNMAKEIQEMRECDARMNEAAMKLESAEQRTGFHESLQVSESLEKGTLHRSENNRIQEKERSECRLLHEEIDETTTREQTTMSTELQDMDNEFEVWEAEAATFCFDLQVSSIQEVLLKNKVQELTGLCQTLEMDRGAKASELEQMKGKLCLMENEISGLKSQICGYGPIVASLREDIALLEHSALHHTKLTIANSNEREQYSENESLLVLKDLQMRLKAVGKLMKESNHPISQNSSQQEHAIDESKIDQIKPHRSLGRENRHRRHNRRQSYPNNLNDSPHKLQQKEKVKASELRNAMQTKDIPLDQASDSSRPGVQKRGIAIADERTDDRILELWEAAEDGDHSLKMSYKSVALYQYEDVKAKCESPFTDSDVEKELGVDKLEVSNTGSEHEHTGEIVDEKKILERLAADAKRLAILQTRVQNCRMKVEGSKKRSRMGKKNKNVDIGRVHVRIMEAEDNLVQLVDLNCQLVNNIELCPEDEMRATIQTWRMKVQEAAEKGGERIGKLEVEVERIEWILLNEEDGKRNKFLRSKSVTLRDFVCNGKGKSKKGNSHCGCFKKANT